MSTIVLRSVKNAPLTNDEVDSNFTNLNNDKTQLGGTYSSGTANGVLFLSSSKVLTTGSALTFDGNGLNVTKTTATFGVPVYQFNTGSINGIFTGDTTLSTVSLGSYSNHPLAFYINNSERMRIDASGNLGLGVTASAWGTLRGFDMTSGAGIGSAFRTMYLSGNAYYNGSNWIYKETGVAGYVEVNNAHKWFSAPSGTAGNAISFTQAMTLDASGNLLVGTTSNISGQSASIQVENSNTHQIVVRNSGATAGNWWRLAVDSSNNFYILNQSTTGVGLASGATSWSSVSDERLKTNLVGIENAATKVSSLRAVTGRYKTDADTVRRSFLIAQDVQSVLPEAVDVGADEQGTLSLRYTDTIPLLVAAIQEQQAIITALTARVAALESSTLQ